MFKTLDDLKGKEKEEKKKTTNSYAGGEKSGLAIENPDDRKAVQDILNQAQQNSMNPQADQMKESTKCKITLYANGFSINDGEFRDFNKPENQKFMKELREQRVPSELRSKYPKGLSVALDDKTSETYTPPPPPSYVAFSGQGVSFGQQAQAQQPVQIQKVQLSQAQSIPVDPNQPSGIIMVRLVDGQSVTLTVNNSTRVQEVYQHIVNLVKPKPGQKVILKSGFPPSKLENMNQTVEQADLIDSEVKQFFE